MSLMCCEVDIPSDKGHKDLYFLSRCSEMGHMSSEPKWHLVQARTLIQIYLNGSDPRLPWSYLPCISATSMGNRKENIEATIDVIA